MHVAVSGSLTPFADGLRRIRGLAFDLAGNLYAADETLNGIVRIGGFPQGTINGFVTDASGRLVAGARVQMLSGPPGAAGQVVMTGADGGFRLPAAPRTYTIVVSADGYKVATLEEVQVFADQETELQIELMSSG